MAELSLDPRDVAKAIVDSYAALMLGAVAESPPYTAVLAPDGSERLLFVMEGERFYHPVYAWVEEMEGAVVVYVEPPVPILSLPVAALLAPRGLLPAVIARAGDRVAAVLVEADRAVKVAAAALEEGVPLIPPPVLEDTDYYGYLVDTPNGLLLLPAKPVDAEPIDRVEKYVEGPGDNWRRIMPRVS